MRAIQEALLDRGLEPRADQPQGLLARRPSNADHGEPDKSESLEHDDGGQDDGLAPVSLAEQSPGRALGDLARASRRRGRRSAMASWRARAHLTRQVEQEAPRLLEPSNQPRAVTATGWTIVALTCVDRPPR